MEGCFPLNVPHICNLSVLPSYITWSPLDSLHPYTASTGRSILLPWGPGPGSGVIHCLE